MAILKALMLIIPLLIIKMQKTTFDAGLAICVSFANEGKT
jgi:hypothetical protein